MLSTQLGAGGTAGIGASSPSPTASLPTALPCGPDKCSIAFSPALCLSQTSTAYSFSFLMGNKKPPASGLPGRQPAQRCGVATATAPCHPEHMAPWPSLARVRKLQRKTLWLFCSVLFLKPEALLPVLGLSLTDPPIGSHPLPSAAAGLLLRLRASPLPREHPAHSSSFRQSVFGGEESPAPSGHPQPIRERMMQGLCRDGCSEKG